MKLTEEQKIDYTRMALNACGFNVDIPATEIVYGIIEAVKRRKGSLDLRTIISVHHAVLKKYELAPYNKEVETNFDKYKVAVEAVSNLATSELEQLNRPGGEK